MALKCAIPRSAIILREGGRITFNHSTGSKAQPCHARGGNSGTTTNHYLSGIGNNPYRERLRLARQQCSPTLDQRGWKLQVVCEKSSSEDPGQELHPLATRCHGSRGDHLFETTNLWWPPGIVTSPSRGKMRPQSSGKY